MLLFTEEENDLYNNFHSRSRQKPPVLTAPAAAAVDVAVVAAVASAVAAVVEAAGVEAEAAAAEVAVDVAEAEARAATEVAQAAAVVLLPPTATVLPENKKPRRPDVNLVKSTIQVYQNPFTPHGIGISL